jgi:hypothetical protein
MALKKVRRLLWRSMEVVVCEYETHLSDMSLKFWRWIDMLLKLSELAFNLTQ